ncbi:ParB N-terminal domain-containing protein [Streptomyces coelicolor]|nr:ParB/RepB/Spo0J family partition protein [Streptomyces toyocaensis]NSL78879.1 ParB N-terminal domain-containing protein [Streptomyces coelicolor]QKN71285.1 ParB N-terminal domain-containing protein [Streptomyces coelicolor]
MALQREQEQIDRQTCVEVEISLLSTVDSPRTSGEDPDHVEALSVAQSPLPPILVHRPTMRVIDGLHRVRAAELRGQDKIAVSFFEGSEADAFVLAVESNTMHGLPLSKADRKRAAARIVTSHPQWSDRMVASVAGIAPGTVADIRRGLPGASAAEESRIGQDGRVRPINAAAGRRNAAKIIAGNPGLSLRQIARMAGISPETARDVRSRLRRGEDPLPGRQSRTSADPGAKLPAPQRSAGDAAVHGRPSGQDHSVVVERLKADPALRLSETGRTLLRLLNLHTIDATEWQRIIDNVPPHCSGIVARLADEYAVMWSELALRLGGRVTETA